MPRHQQHEGAAIPPVVTDAEGQFVIASAPVGAVKVLVDGTTTTRAGEWPHLEDDVVALPGRNNTVGQPIYLLPIDVPNGLAVSETVGGMLTIPDVPGFSLAVEPGAATFPGGSKSGVISATVVHADKVPMTPNFGQQPRLVLTIQPSGVIFDPPARITYPNLDGLAPGQITELYSFDHDLGEFVGIGTGTVTEDGLLVESDPGVGVIKGGWHCEGNPTPTGECEPVAVRVSQPDLTVHIGETLQLSATGTPDDPGMSAYVWSVSDESLFSQTFADGNTSQTHPTNTVDITGLKETEEGTEQNALVTFMTAQTDENGQPLTASNSSKVTVKCPLDSVA